MYIIIICMHLSISIATIFSVSDVLLIWNNFMRSFISVGKYAPISALPGYKGWLPMSICNVLHLFAASGTLHIGASC